MKSIRFLTCLLLFMMILLSSAPVSVSADDTLLPDESVSADATFAEAAEAGTETPVQAQGTVSDLAFIGNTASVTYQAHVSSSIIAAIYDETTGEMLASGNTDAAPSDSTQTVSIQMNLSAEDMPAHFYAKAFLVDRYTNFPLCEPFATERYTTTVQSLLSTSLEDYSDLPSIDFGDGNFVAFSDDVTVIETSSSRNKVTHQEDGSWLFENPDASLQNLSNGDTVSFTDADGTVQMGTVTDMGSTGKGWRLEITPDPDRPSKIAALKFSAKYTGNPEHGNAYSYISSLGFQDNASFSTGLSGKAGIIEGEVSGGFSLEYQHLPDITCVVVWNKGNSYIEVSYASENQLAVTAKGKGSLSITPVSVPLPIKDLVDITVGPKLSLELSSAVEWKGAWSHANHYTIVNGDISSVYETPCFHPSDSSVNLNGELSFSLFGGIDFSALGGDLLKTTVGAELKASVSGEKTPFVAETSDGPYHHLCHDCINGQLGLSLSAKTELNLWNNESMSMKLSHDEELWQTEPVSFYSCNTHGISEMNKSCPYYTWRVRLQMLDAKGSPLPDVDVINAANLQSAGKTDGNGWFTAYLPDGEYDFYVPYGSKKQFHVRVNHEPKILICETDIVKGSCGVNLNYEVLGNTLYITGSGKMYDYSSKTAPWYPYADRISEVVFPDELTGIGSYAFYKMNLLTKVTIPDKVETIGAHAFQQCEKLEGVDLPEELRTVCSYAFDNCINMTDILNFPQKNDITIQSYAFNRLINMYEPLYIPDNVVRINAFAFDSYGIEADSTVGTLHFGSEESRLTYIGRCAFTGSCFMGGLRIPDSVTYIDAQAFSHMENAAGTLTLSAGLTSIEEGTFVTSAFSGELQIPDAVETIDTGAFRGCTNLTSVKLNDGLTHIFDDVFNGCKGLTGTLTIPGSVTYLGSYAFCSCTNISRIVMENGTAPKQIGSWCFTGISKETTALRDVIFADTVTKIGDNAFAYHAGLTTVNLPDSVTEIGGWAFESTGLTGKLILPASLKTIGRSAFESLTTLTEIEFPDQLETIGNYAFKGCTGLTWLELPDSLREIELEAFMDCSGLTGTLILPKNLTSVGIRAFAGTNFTDVVMPAGLTDYGSGMFLDNPSLERIFIKGTPETIYAISKWIITYTGTVYYPQDSSFWASEEAQLKCNSTDGKTINAQWVAYDPSLIGSADITIDDETVVGNGADSMEQDGGSETVETENPAVNESGNNAAAAEDSSENVTVPAGESAPDNETVPEDAMVRENEVIPENEAAPENAAVPENTTDPENVTIPESESLQANETHQENETLPANNAVSVDEMGPENKMIPADAINAAADKTSAEMPAGTGSPKRLLGVFASYTPAAANTASFTDRWPGQAYLFVIVKDKNAENLFAADNLLFIDQKQADSSGALTFAYTLPASAGDCEQLLYGTECIPLKNAKVTVSNATYSGSALTPSVTVKLNNETLTENLHYTVSYRDNILPGTAAVTVSGIAPYYGTAAATFTIQKKQPVITASGFTVTASDKPQTKKLSVTATEAGPVSYSTTSSQLTVDQSGNVTIPANFVGTGTIKITCAENEYYTGKTLSVTVRSKAGPDPSSGGSGSGTPGDSGSNTGGSPSGSGAAGNSSGSNGGKTSAGSTGIRTVNVTWLKAPKLKSLKNTASRKLTVKWTKNKKATGYEIQYARKKNFSDAKSKFVKKSKTKLVLKKLKKGKKYYVRIRSYKQVGTVRYYSAFGKTKKVKIRR